MSLELKGKQITDYLSKLFGKPISHLSLKRLGTGVLGVAYLIEFEVRGERKRLVLKTLSSKGFGQDFPADRANTLIYAHSVFNKLPNHVKSHDVGAILHDGSIASVSK